MASAEPSQNVAWDLLVQPTDRLLTVADLEEFPTDLPSGPIDYELDNGRLVMVAPFTCDRSLVRTNVMAHLAWAGGLKGHGKSYGRVGIVLWRNPDRVVAPDTAFVANKSLPVRTSPEGYLETIPELVVEVRGSRDSIAFVRRKVDHYLKAGVEVVWVVEAETKTVEVHTSGGEVVPYGLADALTLPTIIPDFSLTVADVFRE
jgi:Uma2 family endonuclease